MKTKKTDFDPMVFNAVNPIVGMTVYPKGNVEIRRKNLTQGEAGRGRRGKIKVFSKASRERLALVAKESQIEFETFITLTYGPMFPHSGRKVKNQLHKMLRKMKTYFGYFDYIWFFEFQRRGAPHIHLITSLPEPSVEQRRTFSALWVDDVQGLMCWEYQTIRDRKLLNLRDASLWFHMREKQWERVRDRDGVAKYAVKYALKMQQKVAPDWFGDVGRFWGHSRFAGLPKGLYVKADETTVRRIIHESVDRIDGCDVIPRYIYDCFT